MYRVKTFKSSSPHPRKIDADAHVYKGQFIEFRDKLGNLVEALRQDNIQWFEKTE